MKTFIVTARCGHVGKNKMIQKNLTIIAENGKEAAYKARHLPRVLHHQKNAIVNVKEVNQEQFDYQEKLNRNDAYFKCTSSSMQRILCEELYLEVEHRFEDKDHIEIFEKRISRVNMKLKKLKCDLKYYTTLECCY